MFLVFIWTLLYPRLIWSHGRLIEPPSRSTMWRYGFNNPPNYNDHESYCGGFTRQWQTNGGRCGVCGDPWDEQQVRMELVVVRGGLENINTIIPAQPARQA